MEDLSITKPLGHPNECREFMTPFVDLTNHKNLRLICFTNSPLDLYIVHSLDGKTKGISQRYKLVAGSWRSERFEVQMKYVAIEVINVSDIANSNLVVTVQGTRRNSMMVPAPVVNPELVNESSEPSPRHVEFQESEEDMRKSKSPFRKFIFKKNHPHGGGSSNDRLPGFIPDNCLFVGAKGNRVECLPRGNPYEVLMTGADGHVTWVPLKEMIQMYLALMQKDEEEATAGDANTSSITGWGI